MSWTSCLCLSVTVQTKEAESFIIIIKATNQSLTQTWKWNRLWTFSTILLLRQIQHWLTVPRGLFSHYTSASPDPTPATVWSTEWAWRTSGSVDTRTSRWRRRERWRTSTLGWPSSWPGVSTFVWRVFGEQTSLGWHNASTVAGGIVCVGCSLWIPPSIIWADVPIVWRGTHENSKGMRGRVGSAQARCCGFQKSEDEKLLPCSWQRWFSLGTSETIWTVDNQKAADLFLTLKQ